MKKLIFSLDFETLILVAVWKHPFIFQGSFNITNSQDSSNLLLFFRCECYLEDKMDILDIEFSPYDYKFTHLYSEQSEIHLANVDDDLEQALYLLKFSLKETLKKMIMNPKQYLTQIDEIAMSAISQQIKDHMIHQEHKKMDNDDIGFAVSISFTPTENIGKKAALTLLKINKYREQYH